MNDPVDVKLAADLETTVLAIPGVTAVFRTGGVISNVVETATHVLGSNEDPAPLVRVHRTAERVRVEVAIGVDSTAGAVETTYRVQAAIRALSISRGALSAEIQVTVAHIDGSPAKGAPQ